MVKTPWFPDAVPFVEAAEVGTQKVIKDHSTIGIVVTTDGSFGEIKRDNYVEAEEKIVGELKEIGKPFIVILNSIHPTNTETVELSRSLSDSYDVPVMPINVEAMNEKEIMSILKSALYEFPVMDILVNMPEWVHVLPMNNENSPYISKSYISDLDTASGNITITLESPNELYDQTLKALMGESATTKAGLLKIFATYKEGKEETDLIRSALKQAKTTGYGIVYPTLKDMKLETPEIVKQGNRYGVKLKALASSIHLLKVDVESTFEPIIGSEIQSKELINYLMKDYETDPSSIWKSEIFGRSLEVIVQEGIQAKLNMMPDNTRFKLSNTVTKIVNKGSNNLIAIVL